MRRGVLLLKNLKCAGLFQEFFLGKLKEFGTKFANKSFGLLLIYLL